MAEGAQTTRTLRSARPHDELLGRSGGADEALYSHVQTFLEADDQGVYSHVCTAYTSPHQLHEADDDDEALYSHVCTAPATAPRHGIATSSLFM